MELTFKLKKSPDHVFEHLSDMQKFTAVHPVISKIENIQANKYLVHETLKFGFIPFSFTYPVKVEKNENTKSVTFNATVFKLINIDMIFKIMAEGEFAIIKENIKFKSLLPVKFVMQKVFKEQHTQLFKNIES